MTLSSMMMEVTSVPAAVAAATKAVQPAHATNGVKKTMIKKAKAKIASTKLTRPRIHPAVIEGTSGFVDSRDT